MITLNWAGYKELTVENISNLPTYAGVYKLATYHPSEDKYYPFYVGQAEDIKARTQQHRSDSEENECIKTKFSKYAIYINYASVPGQSDRDSVEVALYNHYEPECNDKDALPDVEPADVSSFN